MSFKERFILFSKDIRFWILLFFIIRLYGITFPPLEVGHNWRQTDGMMIARNFYERDANILYPRVDVAGDQSGIVGCEFPILNYLVYLVSLIFGYQHWYGRIIVLILSSIGILFFYKLIRKYFDESSAFNASILLLVSLWFSFSRKNIPDAFAASLCIISLYYAFRYLDTGRWPSLILFFLLALLGCLSKIIAASILTVLLLPILDQAISLKRKAILTFFSSAILAAVIFWYFVWVVRLNEYGFGDHFFMGLSWTEGLTRIRNEWLGFFLRVSFTPFKYIGFFVFLFAVFLAIKKKLTLQLMVFLLPFLSYSILLIKTGTSVIGDHYYLITVIPAMAFITGCGLAQLNDKRIILFILIVISIESVADQIYDFRIRQPYKSFADLEAIMNRVSKPEELIAINSNDPHNPTAMYFAHRRGWASPNDLLQNPDYLNQIKSKGCKFVVIAKESYGNVGLDFPIVFESDYFKIYSLK